MSVRTESFVLRNAIENEVIYDGWCINPESRSQKRFLEGKPVGWKYNGH